ncbi:hypothetical protein KPL40_15870 [Clostridium gasigenes]|uniref:hypothetical protein n=1 Tax=Clostridium gasigenes TaxID=94869 RepID=UPI001C0B72D2|nr:hypothetical protein [Clostridium gasigenes]MBU3133907.1 hypothetical protein [Clostridium gasigenes]
MKKIKILLDYQCYPLWAYDEQGELICNDLIDELKNETEIKEILDYIQNIYDSLFVDNEVYFEYQGFENEEEKDGFIKKISRVIQLIESKVEKIYIVENKVNV